MKANRRNLSEHYNRMIDMYGWDKRNNRACVHKIKDMIREDAKRETIATAMQGNKMAQAICIEKGWIVESRY